MGRAPVIFLQRTQCFSNRNQQIVGRAINREGFGDNRQQFLKLFEILGIALNRMQCDAPNQDLQMVNDFGGERKPSFRILCSVDTQENRFS